jgi:hypothetical protein
VGSRYDSFDGLSTRLSQN